MADLPKYMQKGSMGNHVTVLQIFLIGMGFGDGIQFDLMYGGVTAEAVKALQKKAVIEPDGNFGPGTRSAVKEKYGFDFEEACRATPGFTVFVQPDGKKELWEP